MSRIQHIGECAFVALLLGSTGCYPVESETFDIRYQLKPLPSEVTLAKFDKAFPSATDEIREAAAKGTLAVGMTREMVQSLCRKRLRRHTRDKSSLALEGKPLFNEWYVRLYFKRMFGNDERRDELLALIIRRRYVVY